MQPFRRGSASHRPVLARDEVWLDSRLCSHCLTLLFGEQVTIGEKEFSDCCRRSHRARSGLFFLWVSDRVC